MKKGILFILITGYSCISTAQDIHFSQMPYSPLTLNPALAGANGDMQGIVNYRSQWLAVATPYKTMAASFDMRIKKKNSNSGYLGIGLNVFSDKSGDALLSTNQVSLNLAYHLLLSEISTIGAAIYGGFGQRSFDASKLQWGNQYDGSTYNNALGSGETFLNESFTYADAGMGFVYSYGVGEKYMTGNNQKLFNTGLAVFHVNKPNYSFVESSNDRLEMRYAFFANGSFGLSNTNTSLVPGFYLNLQGKSQEILFGTYIKYQLIDPSKYTGLVTASSFSLGAFLRNKDAIILKALYEYDKYSIGIAYDVNTSKLKDASKGRGGFEIFLRFRSPSPFNSSKSRM